MMNSKLGGDSSSANKSTTDQYNLEPQPVLNSFSDMVTRLVISRPSIESADIINAAELDRKQNKIVIAQPLSGKPSEQVPLVPQPQGPKRTCKAPMSRKFAHPCVCGQSSNHYKYFSSTNSTGLLPPQAYTSPLLLYDPISRKCLPTSRSRDMLLKDCHSHSSSSFPVRPYHSAPCVYDDLVCDMRRFRCVCKPSLHLYYESNLSTFGCVPIGPPNSPDGRTSCRSGYIYNVISKECQKIFDVNELPPNYTTGVSATQFSFVTIVLIWILLLILIVTAKLRKLRTSNLYRNSPSVERRLHHANSYRRQREQTSGWLHPFIAAVNGHHHLNQHRTTVDRHSRNMTIDESGNYNDTDFFLTNGNRRMNELLSENNFTSSQQSLNNPPPKFEEIYPSCPEEGGNVRPPSIEDLPSYDEAMKLENTMPPDVKE